MKTVDWISEHGTLFPEMSKKTKTKRWEYLGGKVDAEIVQAVKTVAIVSPVPLNVQERMEFFLRKGLVAHKEYPHQSRG